MKYAAMLCLTIASLAVTGCSSTPLPPLNLKEKLTGKSVENRQETLGMVCLEEAQAVSSRWRHVGRGSGYVTDYDQLNLLRSLCLRMTVAYTSSDTHKHTALAQQCKDHIAQPMHSDNPRIAEYANRYHEVCEEMTGQKISLSDEK